MDELSKDEELRIEQDVILTKKKMRNALIIMVVVLIGLGFVLCSKTSDIWTQIFNQ